MIMQITWFESLLSRYQTRLETPMCGGDFIFNSVNLLYCKCYKISFKSGLSYIVSPDWIKKKKSNNTSGKKRW